MLALETGWTPDVIAGDTGQVTDDWRLALHFALYAKAMLPVLQSVDERRYLNLDNLTPIDRAKAARSVMDANQNAEAYRALLFPVDAPDGSMGGQ